MRAWTLPGPPRTVIAAAIAAIVLAAAALVLTPYPGVFKTLNNAHWSSSGEVFWVSVFLILWLAPILLIALGVGVLRGSHQARMGIWGLSGIFVLRFTLYWFIPGALNTPVGLELAIVFIPSLLLATPSARTYFRENA